MEAFTSLKQTTSVKGQHNDLTHHNQNTQSRRYLTIAPLDGSVGRLGNFCFRYASALGIAKANNMTLILPDTPLVQEMRRNFHITAESESDVDVPRANFINVTELHWGVFDTRYYLLPKKVNVRLKWVYSQSWKYFYPIHRTVSKELAARDIVANSSRTFLQKFRVRHKRPIVIGVHVRRGDFLEPIRQQWGYAVASADYFAKAIKYFTDKFGLDKLSFVVSSDDREWCEKSLNFSSAPYTYTPGSSAVEDFVILTQCDHHIISVGSFGWWTAWLGNGEVVYYKDFPTPGSTHSTNHNPHDYYISKWIAL